MQKVRCPKCQGVGYDEATSTAHLPVECETCKGAGEIPAK